MGDGAGGQQAIVVGGGEKRGAGATTDVGGAGDNHGILRAAEGKLRDATLLGGPDNSRSLGGDKGGEVDSLHQPGLHQDGLAEWSGHTQQRLIGKGDAPLGHGSDLSGEAEARQLVEEGSVIVTDAGEERKLIGGVVKGLDELKSGL